MSPALFHPKMICRLSRAVQTSRLTFKAHSHPRHAQRRPHSRHRQPHRPCSIALPISETISTALKSVETMLASVSWPAVAAAFAALAALRLAVRFARCALQN